MGSQPHPTAGLRAQLRSDFPPLPDRKRVSENGVAQRRPGQRSPRPAYGSSQFVQGPGPLEDSPGPARSAGMGALVVASRSNCTSFLGHRGRVLGGLSPIAATLADAREGRNQRRSSGSSLRLSLCWSWCSPTSSSRWKWNRSSAPSSTWRAAPGVDSCRHRRHDRSLSAIFHRPDCFPHGDLRHGRSSCWPQPMRAWSSCCGACSRWEGPVAVAGSTLLVAALFNCPTRKRVVEKNY